MKGRILIIEDDYLILETMAVKLSQMGYEVEAASAAWEGLQKAYNTHPHLILLDVMLPEMDGWQLCARFREMSQVPIIMMTALGDEEDVIRGLHLGADDYLVKPVPMDMLVAKVKAVLRRAYQRSNADIGTSRNILEYQGLTLDLDRYEATLNDKRVNLSPIEFKLLSLLMTHKSQALSKDFLLAKVWGPEYIGESDHLRLYISYLRKKLEQNPAKPKFIHNVWGIGYRFG